MGGDYMRGKRALAPAWQTLKLTKKL